MEGIENKILRNTIAGVFGVTLLFGTLWNSKPVQKIVNPPKQITQFGKVIIYPAETLYRTLYAPYFIKKEGLKNYLDDMPTLKSNPFIDYRDAQGRDMREEK